MDGSPSSTLSSTRQEDADPFALASAALASASTSTAAKSTDVEDARVLTA